MKIKHDRRSESKCQEKQIETRKPNFRLTACVKSTFAALDVENDRPPSPGLLRIVVEGSRTPVPLTRGVILRRNIFPKLDLALILALVLGRRGCNGPMVVVALIPLPTPIYGFSWVRHESGGENGHHRTPGEKIDHRG